MPTKQLIAREAEVTARRHALETLRQELAKCQLQQTATVEQVAALHRQAGEESAVRRQIQVEAQRVLSDICKSQELAGQVLSFTRSVQHHVICEQTAVDSLAEPKLSEASHDSHVCREASEEQAMDREALQLALGKVARLEAERQESELKRCQELDKTSLLVSSYTRLYAHWLMWRINAWRDASGKGGEQDAPKSCSDTDAEDMSESDGGQGQMHRTSFSRRMASGCD